MQWKGTISWPGLFGVVKKYLLQVDANPTQQLSCQLIAARVVHRSKHYIGLPANGPGRSWYEGTAERTGPASPYLTRCVVSD